MCSAKVSIIVPVYKVETYLKQCVDSLLCQTLKEIEIILIDDGSPDNCPQICDWYAAENKQIRVFHQKNAGVSVARNQGIKMATADWIMFVDPDDWLESNAVELLYNKAMECDCDIIYSPFYWSYENKQLSVKVGNDEKGEFRVAEMLPVFLETLLGYRKDKICMAAVWGKIYRKKLIDDNNCRFPEGMKRRQDAIFNLYIIQHVKNIYIIDVPTYHYRQRTTSVCHMISPDHHSIFRRVNSEVYQFMQKYQLWPSYKGPYYYVVIQGIFELCTLYGENISSWSDFHTAISNLRSFCEEEDCKTAIMSTKLATMLSVKEKFVLCLLKLHMYKTITALIYLRNCCSRNTRSI